MSRVISSQIAPVVQLDRISDFGSEGWGFESLQVYKAFAYEI